MKRCKTLETLFSKVDSCGDVYLKALGAFALEKLRRFSTLGKRSAAIFLDSENRNPPFTVAMLVLNREAAENLGRADKAVSPTCFNT